jgi:hypothetical protein
MSSRKSNSLRAFGDLLLLFHHHLLLRAGVLSPDLLNTVAPLAVATANY